MDMTFMKIPCRNRCISRCVGKGMSVAAPCAGSDAETATSFCPLRPNVQSWCWNVWADKVEADSDGRNQGSIGLSRRWQLVWNARPD